MSTMTKGPAAMWVKARLVGAALFALGLAAACGKTNTTESGETHFVMCDTDADCAGVRGAHTCSGGLCRTSDSTAAAGAPGSDTNEQNNEGGGPAQKLLCQSCGPKLNEFDREHCAVSPPAAEHTGCSFEATCSYIGCGGSYIDEDGCFRAACTTDDDCLESERCADLFVDDTSCNELNGECMCGSFATVQHRLTCSPIAVAGPRGKAQGLTITENVIGDITAYEMNLDGAITIQHGVGTDATIDVAQLADSELAEILAMLESSVSFRLTPNLRIALADPEPCVVTKSRDVDIKLDLGETQVEKNVAGCLGLDTRWGGTFQRLLDLVEQ